MGKKGKKVKKTIPIEQMEFYKKKINQLRNHAIYVGAELNALRSERQGLEAARDSLIHYYSNTVYHLVKTEREVRRAQRKLAHAQAMAGDDTGKVDPIEPYRRATVDHEGVVTYTLDKYRDIFRAKLEIFKERIRTRKEAWERRLQGDIAVMQVTNRAQSKEISKINEIYAAAIINETRKSKELDDKLYDQLEATWDQEFSNLLLNKEEQVNAMQRNHDRQVEELRIAYEDLKKSDFIVHYRAEMIKLRDEVSLLGSKLTEYFEYYSNFKFVKGIAEIQAKQLQDNLSSHEMNEKLVCRLKQKYKELYDTHHNLTLETNLLQDVLESEDEVMKTLQKDCNNQVMQTRLKQQRIRYILDVLANNLKKEIQENKEIVDRYKGKGTNEIEELCRLYASRRAMKYTIADLSDLALRESNLRTQNLKVPVWPVKPEGTKKNKDGAQGVNKVPIGRVMNKLHQDCVAICALSVKPAVVRR